MEVALDPAAIGCGGQHQPLPRGAQLLDLSIITRPQPVSRVAGEDPRRRLARDRSALDDPDQLDDVDGLGQIAVEPDVEEALAVASHSLRGQRDHGDRGGSHVAPKLRQGFDAVDPGQLHVHQARAPGRASARVRPHPRRSSPRACCTPLPAARRGRASCSFRCPRRRGCAHPPLRPAFSIGSVNTKRLPCPDRLSTQMRPRCSSTRRFESASPRPVPIALSHADVRLLELLEDPFLVVCGDTGPGVRHRHEYLSVLPRRSDDDASAARRELDRVREQVEDDLLDAPLVTVDEIDVGCRAPARGVRRSRSPVPSP